MNKIRFASLLLEWYYQNKRDLPWRNTKSPYKIWLSEILLQQTRVSQGLPYYLGFVKKYPTLKHLASAPLAEVLRLWQGLGYYTRARNLHACAKKVVSDLKGEFPNNFNDLKKLPGIGDYTAAAIASVAFNQSVAVVDGNVFRVLARLFNLDLNISSPQGKKYFTELANSLIPKENAGDFNQAMMEFGAIHCTPHNPKCEDCLFKKQCMGYQAGRHLELPVKSRIQKRKKRHFNYFVCSLKNKVWMRQRTDKDIWNGLFEFYLIETSRTLKPMEAEKELKKTFGIMDIPITVSYSHKQILSHQEIYGRFYNITLSKTPKSLSKKGRFYTMKEIEELAKPVIINRYFDQALK